MVKLNDLKVYFNAESSTHFTEIMQDWENYFKKIKNSTYIHKKGTMICMNLRNTSIWSLFIIKFAWTKIKFQLSFEIWQVNKLKIAYYSYLIVHNMQITFKHFNSSTIYKKRVANIASKGLLQLIKKKIAVQYTTCLTYNT